MSDEAVSNRSFQSRLGLGYGFLRRDAGTHS
jgi:hypothetical protein